MDTATLQENRRKAVEFLKTTELPQIHCALHDPQSGGYCAYGAIGKALGVDAADYEEEGEVYWRIGDMLDVYVHDSDNDEQFVIGLNDRSPRTTFAQIADALAERWELV